MMKVFSFTLFVKSRDHPDNKKMHLSGLCTVAAAERIENTLSG